MRWCLFAALLIWATAASQAPADTCTCIDQVTGNESTSRQPGPSLCAVARHPGRCAMFSKQAGTGPDLAPPGPLRIANLADLIDRLKRAGIDTDADDAL